MLFSPFLSSPTARREPLRDSECGEPTKARLRGGGFLRRLERTAGVVAGGGCVGASDVQLDARQLQPGDLTSSSAWPNREFAEPDLLVLGFQALQIAIFSAISWNNACGALARLPFSAPRLGAIRTRP
jgi:hypothetical protein